MASLTRVRTRAQISAVAELAREIWTEHYPPIIGPGQVAYMLKKFQSPQAIAAQLAEGYEYYTLAHGGRMAGYMALVPQAGKLMLSKIYVRKSGRGRGWGRVMLEFAERLCRARRIKILWLTVNRRNSQSVAWYRRRGFKQAGTIVRDIGGSFVMEDYRMEKTIGPAASSRPRQARKQAPPSKRPSSPPAAMESP